MIENSFAARPISQTNNRFLPWLLVLFFGGGCAALIYEIVWFQLLQLVIGSSAVSLAVLLGTFMGGMCLGSLALPRIISVNRHPLRVYALLELGIGIIGIIVLFAMPLVARFYMTNVGGGFSGIPFRAAICAICLLPPTLLMGATLPAISRWIEASREGVAWLGFFYGGNTAGAVFGCLLAGFYLLRVHDMATATYVAAGINGCVALAGLFFAAISLRSLNEVHLPPSQSENVSLALAQSSIQNPLARPTPGTWIVYVTIMLSGFTALGAEVIWTRLLSLLLGPTVYTFSIILAVFLMGLGIGSNLGSILARGIRRPRLALGFCQFFLTAACAWTGYMLSKSLPFWPINPALSTNHWFSFQLDLVRCMWAILPATCLWGASFPLALAAAASNKQDPGKLVGGVYAANTLGAIIGALVFSMILIPWLGTQNSQRVLIGVAGATAILSFLPGLSSIRLARRKQSDDIALQQDLNPPSPEFVDHESATVPALRSDAPIQQPATYSSMVWSLLTVSLTVILAWSVPKVPWQLIAFGRSLITKGNQADILYSGEGINASVAVTEVFDGIRNFHVSGKIEASSEPQDMRLQRMLGHIPALLHPNPRSVLVVGCGAGVTAGSFVLHPSIEQIVICEIEPLIPKVVAQYFDEENYNVVKDPRTHVVYDDARHYVLTTKEKFDVITSDPIHPWVKGAATLYTKEYFEMVKRRLNPGGVVTQWVPLYESNLDVVKSEIATFFEVFPNGTIWSNDTNGKGYDIVLFGQVDAARIDVDELNRRLERDDHQSVAQSLGDVGFGKKVQIQNRGKDKDIYVGLAVGLLATYAGRGHDLGPWLERAQINRDRNLRLQYLAGIGSNLYQENLIFDDMELYRKFPEELFVASDERKQSLRLAIERTQSEK